MKIVRDDVGGIKIKLHGDESISTTAIDGNSRWASIEIDRGRNQGRFIIKVEASERLLRIIGR